MEILTSIPVDASDPNQSLTTVHLARFDSQTEAHEFVNAGLPFAWSNAGLRLNLLFGRYQPDTVIEIPLGEDLLTASMYRLLDHAEKARDSDSAQSAQQYETQAGVILSYFASLAENMDTREGLNHPSSNDSAAQD